MQEVSTGRHFSPAQLKLMRRSIARSCTDAEFDEFIAVASMAGLDPMRRQIAPLVVDAHDPERRRLIAWATIDGLRVIAARQGDYRPPEAAPALEIDPARIDADLNPLGLVRAEVRAWKYRDGHWFPVAGEAWWDECAPLRPSQTGSNELVLDASWRRMGRVMLAKCAEAQALRRGWPDLLSGLYTDEELHSLRLQDETASARLRAVADDEARRKLSDRETLWFVFDPNGELEAVARDDVITRLTAFFEQAPSTEAIEQFQRRNQQSLQIFWDWAPLPAWELKALAERRVATLVSHPDTRRSKPRRSRSERSAQQIASPL